MDQDSSAESSKARRDEYYNYSPLGILSDTYFTHPVQYDEQTRGNFAPSGLAPGAFGVGTAGYTGLTGLVPQQVPPQADYQGYHTQTQMDLDLLSAENYQEGVYPQRSSRERASDGSIELYGGLLATSSGEMEPTNSSTTMKTRRTKKEKSTSADESGTRQRGRPRLDTRDQTAAEVYVSVRYVMFRADFFSKRRRTQIRLAQRAYRQRKETTISGLNERVASLEKTIDDMNKSFLEFNDLAIASGIERGNPSLARNLQSTAERFAELVKNSSHESDIDEDEENPALSSEVFAVEKTQPSKRRRREAASAPHPVATLGYQTTLEEEADDHDGETAQRDSGMQVHLERSPRLSQVTSTEAMQQYQDKMPDAKDAGHHGTLFEEKYRIEIADTTNSTGKPTTTESDLTLRRPGSSSEKSLYDLRSLPLPNNYSFQETSFARRLLRSAIQESYRLMTDPNSRQEDMRRFGRFSWSFTNSSRMIECMRRTIAKTAKDNLELWQVPRLHIGGAGLHFPRVGIDAGGASPPAWWANQAPMGPFPDAQPENPPVPSSMTISEIIRTTDMDGEWFDSNDVEQYLRGKGLFLDSQSQVVEIPETVNLGLDSLDVQALSASSPAASSKESNGGPRSPSRMDLLWSSDPFLQSADYLWSEDVTSAPEIPDLNTDVLYTHPTDQKVFLPSLEFNMGTAIVPPTTPPAFRPRMRKFVDVEKFLRSIF